MGGLVVAWVLSDWVFAVACAVVQWPCVVGVVVGFVVGLALTGVGCVASATSPLEQRGAAADEDPREKVERCFAEGSGAPTPADWAPCAEGAPAAVQYILQEADDAQHDLPPVRNDGGVDRHVEYMLKGLGHSIDPGYEVSELYDEAHALRTGLAYRSDEGVYVLRFVEDVGGDCYDFEAVYQSTKYAVDDVVCRRLKCRDNRFW